MPFVKNVTHLGRVIDVRVPSNLYAVLLGGAFAVVALMLDAPPIAAGGSAFLAWALGRELDPDRVITANLAALAGGATALHFETASLGAVYLFLISARILSRTTGLSPTTVDLAVHLPIAAFVARSTVGWAASLVLVAAFALDSRAKPGSSRNKDGWAAAVAIAATVVAAVTGFEFWGSGVTAAWVVAAVGLLGGLSAIRPEPVTSKADYTDETLTASRVALSRRVTVAGAVLVAILTAGPGIAGVAAVWVTLAVLGAARAFSR